MTPEERESLIAAVTTAHRERDAHGNVKSHRAFYDLDEDDRVLAFDEASALRTIEAALDPDGLSTTAKAVLARLR